jgi:hypothetical protein
MDCMGEKGLERECRGSNSQKATNSWARKEREFGQSFTILMLDYGMRPQDLLLYHERIVIQLGDGL